MQSNVRVNKPH